MRYQKRRKPSCIRAPVHSLLACNFLTKSVFECDVDLIAFLGQLGEWQNLGEIVSLDAGHGAGGVGRRHRPAGRVVSRLMAEGRRSPRWKASSSRGWKWGLPTAMMHFCVQDPDHMSLGESEALQRQQGGRRPAAGTLLAQWRPRHGQAASRGPRGQRADRPDGKAPHGAQRRPVRRSR